MILLHVVDDMIVAVNSFNRVLRVLVVATSAQPVVPLLTFWVAVQEAYSVTLYWRYLTLASELTLVGYCVRQSLRLEAFTSPGNAMEINLKGALVVVRIQLRSL